MLLAAILALALRLNIPAAVLGTFITNPLTIVPLYVFAYWIGCALLGLHAEPMHFELTWDWLSTQLLPIWKPFLLGCFVMGTTDRNARIYPARRTLAPRPGAEVSRAQRRNAAASRRQSGQSGV